MGWQGWGATKSSPAASGFPYCRAPLEGPRPATQGPRRPTQPHLTPGDGRDTLAVTSLSEPQLPRPYNGKMTPLSQPMAGTPREHAESMPCRRTHCCQPSLPPCPFVCAGTGRASWKETRLWEAVRLRQGQGVGLVPGSGALGPPERGQHKAAQPPEALDLPGLRERP